MTTVREEEVLRVKLMMTSFTTTSQLKLDDCAEDDYDDDDEDAEDGGDDVEDYEDDTDNDDEDERRCRQHRRRQ